MKITKVSLPKGESISNDEFWNLDAVQEICILLAQFYGTAINREVMFRSIREWIYSESNHILIAKKNDVAVGMGWLHIVNEPLHTTGIINHLITKPEHRRKGIGRRLMEELEREARIQGCDRAKLTSRDDRDEAHRLYLKMDYRRRDTNVFERKL